MIQELELSGAVGDFSGALYSSSLDSCSPSEARDADDAMSESSWTSLAKGTERDWWSVDLEGDMEKLEVEGLLSDGGSVDPKRKMGNWSARIKTTKEGIEELEGAENEKQEKEVEVVEATLHEASAEVQSPEKKGDTCRVRSNARLHAGDFGNQPGRSR